MSDAITSTKLEQTGKNIWGQPVLCECMGICVVSPAHENDMRGYLVSVLIIKYLSHRFFKNSATIYHIERPYCGIFGGFLEIFLEGSVDSIIYRDYTANRRHLFTVVWPVLAGRLASTC